MQRAVVACARRGEHLLLRARARLLQRGRRVEDRAVARRDQHARVGVEFGQQRAGIDHGDDGAIADVAHDHRRGRQFAHVRRADPHVGAVRGARARRRPDRLVRGSVIASMAPALLTTAAAVAGARVRPRRWRRCDRSAAAVRAREVGDAGGRAHGDGEVGVDALGDQARAPTIARR